MVKINLQYFGGRGGASGLANIVRFPTKKEESKKTSKWNYPGYVESVDKIEKAVNEANTRTKAEQAYRGIIQQEKNISAEIQRAERGDTDTGDINVLITQRRRLRQLRTKLNKKEIL